MKSSVCVTGASGFVGLALTRALIADGHTVVAVIRDWTREPPGAIIVRGDVTDRLLCQRVLADYEISTVYHLAAQSIVSSCAEDPLTALLVAGMGTAYLCQAAVDAGRPIRVVVSTSDKVYGSSPSPYVEETPLDARHPYEVSKAWQDLVARMYFSFRGADVSVVRAVNIYGPGDPNNSRLIPQTSQRALRGEPPLLHAGAQEMRRQYVYIDDVVRAFRLVAEKGIKGEPYCVGSLNAPLSAIEVMRVICHQAGRDWVPPAVQERDERFHEIASQAVNDAKLRALGWAPTVEFNEGIQRTLMWYQSAEIDAARARELR